jgi:hypothetical protein
VRLLSSDFRPIQPEEIEEQVKIYKAYVDSFSREKAQERPLTYVVTKTDSEPNLSSIDRWYERDRGEQYGPYTLYRVKPRN